MISPSYFESFSSQCCVDKSWYSEVTGSWVGASLSHLLEMLPSSSSLWEHNPGGKEGCGIATFSSGGHTSDSDKGDGRKSPRELSGIYHITSKKRVRTHKMLTGEGQGVSLYKVSMEKVMNISGNINRSEEINPVRELIFNTRFGIDDQNRISGHTTDDFFFKFSNANTWFTWWNFVSYLCDPISEKVSQQLIQLATLRLVFTLSMVWDWPLTIHMLSYFIA